VKRPGITTATTVLATAWLAHFAVDQEEGGMTEREWRSWTRWTLGLATATTAFGAIGAFTTRGPRRGINGLLAAVVGVPTFTIAAKNLITSE